MLYNKNFPWSLYVFLLSIGSSSTNSYLLTHTATTTLSFGRYDVCRPGHVFAPLSFVCNSSSSSRSNTFLSSTTSTVNTPTSKTRSSKDVEKSWQAKLDEVFGLETDGAERQILLSELLNSNDKIRDSVMEALANRKLDPILTPKQKKIQEGTRAVIRQVANDILPQITSSAAAEASSRMRGSESSSSSSSPLPFINNPEIESIGTRLLSVVSDRVQKNLVNLQDDLTDPLNKIPRRLERQRTELLQEARNLILEKPEGLEEPSYKVIESCDLYEIRHYEAYSVVSTSVTSGMEGMIVPTTAEGTFSAGSSAFNALAAYMSGENEESKIMDMTTPVITTSDGDMQFYVTTDHDNERIPRPVVGLKDRKRMKLDDIDSNGSSFDDRREVEIVHIPPALLAVRKFTGFVTNGEIARQKDTLLQALEMDDCGFELDCAHGTVVPHILFQYNPPYSLPIVRCNEIGVPVTHGGDDNDTTAKTFSQREEWNIQEDGDE